VLVVDIGVGMCQAAPGYDSPLQIASDILQMIVQRKVCGIEYLTICLQSINGRTQYWTNKICF
jgi:hypothetical protein